MKVVLVGTEPASHGLTPWDDLSWEVWACSHPTRNYRRADRVFELHNPSRVKRVIGAANFAAYWTFLQMHPNVWTIKRLPSLPNAHLLDVKKLLKEFGPHFFSSSIAWMMATAILTKGVTDIQLCGVDCAAGDEFDQQRPGVQFFIREAQARGISVSAPLESDILREAPIYGLREFNPMWVKAEAKKLLIEKMLVDVEKVQLDATEKAHHYRGALEALEYFLRTWDDRYDAERGG